MKTKMVIVWRKDLKCRKGKFASQIAHACLGLFTEKFHWELFTNHGHMYSLEISDVEKHWLENDFTKVVVGCKDENELLDLEKEVIMKNIRRKLITDNGTTEFKDENGKPKPTIICLAIGPDEVEIIDKITGHLDLM